MNKLIRHNELVEFYTPEKCFITEVLNNPSFPTSIAIARVEPGITTEWHTLVDTDEVYYVLEGKGRMEIDNNVAGDMEAKDAVHIPANKSQRITNTGSTDLIFLCICTPRFQVENYKSE